MAYQIRLPCRPSVRIERWLSRQPMAKKQKNNPSNSSARSTINKTPKHLLDPTNGAEDCLTPINKTACLGENLPFVSIRCL